MRLLELVLLPLLSPQEPAPKPPAPEATTPAPVTAPVSEQQPAPAPSAPAVAPAPTGDNERAVLAAAERAGAKADPATLAPLTSSNEEAIAARAAWLLGKCEDPRALDLLRAVSGESPHATARLQAMSALLRHKDNASVPAGIKGLEDADIRVRTSAAQLLGKLRRPAGITPLVALIESGKRDETAPATDVQAALVALHDLDATEELVGVAAALNVRPANGIGQALVYYFQQLSPKLAPEQQVTLLLTVLDHQDTLLRRYAIGRLGELADPKTATALEGRLAKEGPELRPLVEVALTQVRGEPAKPRGDHFERALAELKGLAAAAETRWNKLSSNGRIIVGASPVALLLMLMLLGRRRRRRAEAIAAAAAVALVAPSEEHLAEIAAEAEALEAGANEVEANTGRQWNRSGGRPLAGSGGRHGSHHRL